MITFYNEKCTARVTIYIVDKQYHLEKEIIEKNEWIFKKYRVTGNTLKYKEILHFMEE
ncbi:MAG: hypothetical protein RBR02_06235 [Desulfuromonadaceae bacterium]|nr:hypothetical protein [Desulfuromonadaceae bacterium]